MYIRCKETENQYIIDTEKKIVYHVNDGDVQIVKFNGHNFDSDNFMRWHPYLEEIETTISIPHELKLSFTNSTTSLNPKKK